MVTGIQWGGHAQYIHPKFWPGTNPRARNNLHIFGRRLGQFLGRQASSARYVWCACFGSSSGAPLGWGREAIGSGPMALEFFLGACWLWKGMGGLNSHLISLRYTSCHYEMDWNGKPTNPNHSSEIWEVRYFFGKVLWCTQKSETFVIARELHVLAMYTHNVWMQGMD